MNRELSQANFNRNFSINLLIYLEMMISSSLPKGTLEGDGYSTGRYQKLQDSFHNHYIEQDDDEGTSSRLAQPEMIAERVQLSKVNFTN